MGLQDFGLMLAASLTPEQNAAMDKAIKFRGEYIEQFIQLEHRIELCVEKFFNKQNSDSIKGFFHFYFFTDRGTSFHTKINMLHQIVKFDVTGGEQLFDNFNLIIKLGELRTYTAHFPINPFNLEAIEFYKKWVDYKGGRIAENTQLKTVVDDTRKVIITPKNYTEIELQMKISFSFLYKMFYGLIGDEDKGLEFAIDETEKEIEAKINMQTETEKNKRFDRDKLIKQANKLGVFLHF